MNRINRKLEYALMALRYMSRKIPGQLTTAKEVTDALRTPFDATSRVMQIMAQRGILRSEQGAMGGYMIIRDLAKVSLLELIECIEGRPSVARCVSDEDSCEIRPSCNIVAPVIALNQRIQNFYASITLKELLFDQDVRSTASPRSELRL
ncbi:MAG: Rrf2 family transcriptional regulator [Bdellovibrionaceae bacterium]|nr:Rrf2 family transcriptional regulator [Pseudobdellovibrionaceae bacterium]